MNTIPLLARCPTVLIATLLIYGCGAPLYKAPETGEPRTVVLWISIDGFRPDYVERADTPYFDKLMSEGAYSLEHVPIFPSLTFPNHVSQATGVTADRHGVPLNSFYDMERDRKYSYPGFPDLLQAEPIWTTAQRQNRRTAVYDWVLSHSQESSHAASYFGDRYNSDLTDKERMRILINAWRKDKDKQPLQLLMAYMVTPDKLGHEFGPDAPEIADGMRKMDQHMSWVHDQAMRLFERRMTTNDVLYIVVTTDHGMSAIHTLVHSGRLTEVTREEEDNESVIMVTTGNLGHIFLHKIEDESERAARAQRIFDTLAQYDFITVYTRDTLPERWGYNHPTRVGDIVMLLDVGYAFGRRNVEGIMASAAEIGGPLGMHGYDPHDHPEMNGIAFFWRYPEPLGGKDLGAVHSLQLHATIANLLGIEPAAGARTDGIKLE